MDRHKGGRRDPLSTRAGPLRTTPKESFGLFESRWGEERARRVRSGPIGPQANPRGSAKGPSGHFSDSERTLTELEES